MSRLNKGYSAGHAVALLELCFCLVPLTIVWLWFAPAAAWLGAKAAHRVVTAEQRVSPYFDVNEADPEDVPARMSASMYQDRVASVRAHGVREMVPLLWVAGGLAGIIALWSMVLPRARGLDSRETLSSKLIVGLTSGAVVAVWVVLTIRPSGPADKAHLYWVLLYSAIAGLGVAVHQASTVIWRRGAT